MLKKTIRTIARLQRVSELRYAASAVPHQRWASCFHRVFARMGLGVHPIQIHPDPRTGGRLEPGPLQHLGTSWLSYFVNVQIFVFSCLQLGASSVTELGTRLQTWEDSRSTPHRRTPIIAKNH